MVHAFIYGEDRSGQAIAWSVEGEPLAALPAPPTEVFEGIARALPQVLLTSADTHGLLTGRAVADAAGDNDSAPMEGGN